MVKTLTILVDFADCLAATEIPTLTPATTLPNIYATGTTEAATFVPYESVREYYRQASQGKVTLDTTSWGGTHSTTIGGKHSTRWTNKAGSCASTTR